MIGEAIWPLLSRYPALAAIPRLRLRSAPTPVQHLPSLGPGLWIKRDDLTAARYGGNKVRSLEFLLGRVTPTDVVVTAGARASTHALTTAVHARPIAREIHVASWPQEMHPVAEQVAERLAQSAIIHRFPDPVSATAWLWWRRRRGDVAVPAGGTSALGIVGHVNAAFELADQVQAGELPEPHAIVVPLGTGGTAAGLALGIRLAGMRSRVIAVRVVTRVIGRAGRIRHLASGTAGLMERVVGSPVSDRIADLTVVHDQFGGAYARPVPRAREAAERLVPTGIMVDATYSAKALVTALEEARTKDVLFWLTFDSRWISSRNHTPHV